MEISFFLAMLHLTCVRWRVCSYRRNTFFSFMLTDTHTFRRMKLTSKLGIKNKSCIFCLNTCVWCVLVENTKYQLCRAMATGRLQIIFEWNVCLSWDFLRVGPFFTSLVVVVVLFKKRKKSRKNSFLRARLCFFSLLFFFLSLVLVLECFFFFLYLCGVFFAFLRIR